MADQFVTEPLIAVNEVQNNSEPPIYVLKFPIV